jgi:general secretion pathway protein K
MNSQRGIALLLVLWVLALLSVLLAGLMGWVHLQNRQALWQHQHTQALLAAEAGLGLAVMAQLDPDVGRRWRPDGQAHALRFEDMALEVRLLSEQGKVDLNTAPASQVARLAQACGAAPSLANGLGQALDVRRGGNQAPLRLLEEWRALPGMAPSLYACMLPYVTVWSGMPGPDPRLAMPWLRQALGLPAAGAVPADGGAVLTVHSRATTPAGYTATLQVTLILNPSNNAARPYRVLRWQAL